MATADHQDVLEYARLHSLCQDHLADPYPFSCPIDWKSETNESLDDSQLTQLHLSTNISTDERLNITKEGAQLIASIARDESALPDPFTVPIFDTYRLKKLRLELPLLKSDHDNDCREFLQRTGYKANLTDIKFPNEDVDEENDEGLTFPARFWKLGPEMMQSIAKEKVEVTRDGMEFLQTMLSPVATAEDEKEVWESCCVYRVRRTLEPVTPPLSPALQPQPPPFEPSSSACEIPLLSDPLTPEDSRLGAVEANIFMNDVPTPIRAQESGDSDNSPIQHKDAPMNLGNIFLPLTYLDEEHITPPASSRVRMEDLKVEQPLTPLDRSVAQPKSVHFSDFIEEMQLNDWSSSPDPRTDPMFEQVFGSAAQMAKRQVEQEQLVAADATARVEVPLINQEMPKPPWHNVQHQEPASLLKLQRSMIEKAVQGTPEWPGSKKEERKLNWVPIRHEVAKIDMEESTIEDDGVFDTFIDKEDEQVITSSELTWKPEGLRILKIDDEDDEPIEPGEYDSKQPHEVSYLVRKRKMELEARDAAQPDAHDSMTRYHPTHSVAQPIPSTASFPALKAASSNISLDTGLLLGGGFSAGNALDHFLELRAKKPKLNSSYFPAGIGPPKREVVQKQPASLPHRASPRLAAPTIPSPAFTSPTEPVQLIVASTLLKHRSLIKRLSTLLPSLALVERDFGAYDTTTWMPGSVTRSPIKSSLAAEADVILSPSAGVIITTLQKVKQKPLPGQKAKVAIIDRMEKVSLRYEKVAVLVSEGRVDETTNGLEETDCTALSDFIGFTCGLASTITVQFVAGGEETLAKWLASSIVQHRVGGLELLEDETYWELFLRRAGMNAFAAHAVIGALKAPDGVDTTSPSKVALFGLTAFVEMSAEERLRRFGGLCGSMVMARVSNVVDARWK